MTNNCNWEMIESFQSLGEFKRFTDWIESQVTEGIALEVPVKELYAAAGIKERWFQCLSSNSIWRLVYPDGPFHGYWGAVLSPKEADGAPK
jgi:hypothetical protein